MKMRIASFSAGCLLVFTLSGCAGAFDPYQRPGNWTNTGAQNVNLAQEVANKADLISGHGDPTSNGVAASAAIDLALGPDGAGTAKGLQTPTTDVVASTGN
ncbi:MAG: hypothetical protein POH28_12090 [Acidocella sp.]|nr:hypothetical protein [Acidocella sp.]